MSIYEDLEQKDAAIEIISAMKGRKIVAIAREKMKPRNERDLQKIEDLYDELNDLDRERVLMYKGDKEVIRKILTEYSAIIKNGVPAEGKYDNV